MKVSFVVGMILVIGTMTVDGHHAFSSEFDATKPVRLQGTLTKIEWINPHAWIHVDVKTPKGAIESWMIEAGTPNALVRRGFSKQSLAAGTPVIIDGYQAIDGSRKANGRDMTFADGRKLFMGSSGTGAPRDGRDPSDKPR